MDDDPNQPSNSDDEEHKQLSIASPFSTSQCSSPVIIENQTTSFNIENYANNICPEKPRKIYQSDRRSSKEQCEYTPDAYTEEKEPHSAVTKRKRKQQTSSSSNTTTAKQSSRLAAKRVRIE